MNISEQKRVDINLSSKDYFIEIFHILTSAAQKLNIQLTMKFASTLESSSER